MQLYELRHAFQTHSHQLLAAQLASHTHTHTKDNQ